jgi:uncharacterized protein
MNQSPESPESTAAADFIIERLRRASYLECEDFVKSELAKGNPNPINSSSKRGLTPFGHAILYHKEKVVCELLIKLGADVNLTFNGDYHRKGRKALHHSLYDENTEICELLIKSGADVNAKDIDGYTPLQLGVSGSLGQMISNETCMLLIEAGADVKTTNNCGCNVFHSIATSSSSRKSLVNILIKHGANLLEKDNEGLTPIDLAERWKNRKLLDIYKQELKRTIASKVNKNFSNIEI